MTEHSHTDPTMIILKKWHLVLLIGFLLLSAGIQIGLAVARFSALERTDTEVSARVQKIEDWMAKVPELVGEIKSLNTQLKLMQDYNLTPKRPASRQTGAQP